jgi:hypothetical protein
VPTRGGCHGAASRCLRLPMACWPANGHTH